MQNFLMVLINILSIIFPYLIICIALSIILACIFYFWKKRNNNSTNTFKNTLNQLEQQENTKIIQVIAEKKIEQEEVERVIEEKSKAIMESETIIHAIKTYSEEKKISLKKAEVIFKNNIFYLLLLYKKSLGPKDFFANPMDLTRCINILPQVLLEYLGKDTQELFYTFFTLNFVPPTSLYEFIYEVEEYHGKRRNFVLKKEFFPFLLHLLLLGLKNYHFNFLHEIFNHADNYYLNLQEQLRDYFSQKDMSAFAHYTKQKIQILEIIFLKQDEKDPRRLDILKLEAIKDKLQINIPENLEKKSFQKAIYLIQEYPKIKPYHLDNSYLSVDYLSGAFYNENQIFCTFVFSEKNVFTWNELTQFSEKEYIILSYLMNKNLLKKEDSKEEIGKIVKKMQLYHIHFIQLFEGKIGDLNQLSNVIKDNPIEIIEKFADVKEGPINKMVNRLNVVSQQLSFFKKYEEKLQDYLGYNAWIHILYCYDDIFFKKLVFFSQLGIFQGSENFLFQNNYTQEQISCMEKRCFQFEQLCKEAYYAYVSYINAGISEDVVQNFLLLDFQKLIAYFSKKLNLEWKDLLFHTESSSFEEQFLKPLKDLLLVDKLLASQDAINEEKKEIVIKLDETELKELNQIYSSIMQNPIDTIHPEKNTYKGMGI